MIKSIPSKETFESYFFNHSNTETAHYFGVCGATIFKWARKLGVKRKSNRHKDLFIDLTSRQKEILTGTMLGDGELSKIGFRDKLSAFSVTHCNVQREYVEWKYEEFAPFSSKIKHEFDNNGFPASIFWTVRHPVFTELENKWYLRDCNGNYILKNSKRRKIVPNSIRLSPLALAVWYLDDGWRPKHDRQIYISTQGFSFEECDFLVSQMKELGVNCKVRKRFSSDNEVPEIAIPAASSLNFLELIEGQVPVSCFKHKLIKLGLFEGRICAIQDGHEF